MLVSRALWLWDCQYVGLTCIVAMGLSIVGLPCIVAMGLSICWSHVHCGYGIVNSWSHVHCGYGIVNMLVSRAVRPCSSIKDKFAFNIHTT